MAVTIGITQGRQYELYSDWILRAPEAPNVIPLSPGENNVADVEKCHGILLAGGEDVHPRRYQSPEYYERLALNDVDEKRDEFEWRIVERTLASKKSILGLCRGLQLMNVYLGGTLIFDIPAAKNHHGHGKKNNLPQWHGIEIKPGSLLHELAGSATGEVNSNHHQAPDAVASELAATAWAEPAVIEALEWREARGKPWMLLVQWHPERMEDQQNPLADGIRSAFLASMSKV